MNKVTTSNGYIRVGKSQTGWSVEKTEDGKNWTLSNFDDEIVFTAKTKRACLSHYECWYTYED